MEKKLKFRSVVSLVIGSQIGSGAFLLPASLAFLGPISLIGWLISGTGAILLALVFAALSTRISKGGGPHVYIEEAFGRKCAFFVAWTYWLISWISSIAVIVAAVGCLSSIFGLSAPWFILLLEVVIFSSITWINIRSSVGAGSFELFLTILKCIPLVVIPIAGFFFFQKSHFVPFIQASGELGSILNTACLMTFWGFIGLESATTTSAMIENPTKTIPRAVLIGTILVAVIYFINSLSVMGVVPLSSLASSQAPYADAARIMAGGGWDVVIAIIAFAACIGTLNAWVLTSGQIAAEAAKDGLFPPFFGKVNRSGSPYASLLVAYGCTLPLLALTLTPNILTQLGEVIDVSVTTFLFIYLSCSLALIQILRKEQGKKRILYILISLAASGFCVWILVFVTIYKLLLCSLFVLSGLPVYLWRRKKRAAIVRSL